MTNTKRGNESGPPRKILFLALLAVFSPAHAQDADVAALINPDSATVAPGLGWASGNGADRALFGQYNGLREHSANLLLDFEYVRRDGNGMWTRASGRNLGLDVFDLGLGQEKQGDWKYAIGYTQMVRREPYTVNTGMQGAGSASPSIGSALAVPGTGSDYNPSIKRKGFHVTASKAFGAGLSFDASYRFEERDGARLSGIGGYCSNAIAPICVGANGTVAALYLTPEPIDSTTQQLEAKLNYSSKRFNVTLGYYGGLYNNRHAVLTPGFANGAATITNTGDRLGPLASVLSQPLALPPDNRSNQVYLSGNTSLPWNTRINFKAAYAHATQDAEYPSQLLASAAPGRSSLGGALDTTLLQAGLSSRPLPKLTLNANARWEDRQDKTDLGIYTIGPNATLYTNNPASSTVGSAKAEAGYQLTDQDRASLGVDYVNNIRDRPVSSTWIPSTSLAGMRESNNETGFYGEWRRSMSETLNAAVNYRYAKRQGYHWYALDPSTGYAFVRFDSFSNSSGTFPSTMIDRERQTVKVTGDWSPIEALSLTFSLENGKDSYDAPNDAHVNDTKVQFYNIDAALKLSDNWKMTGYASYGKQNLNMQQGIGYVADLDQRTFATGVGFVGAVRAGIEVGGEVSYVEDRGRYNLTTTTAVPVSNLPDNKYRATLVKLYGKVAIDRKSEVRLDLIQQWARYDDWTWGYGGVPFTYSDNTTLTIQPKQNVTFIGVRYIYRFR